MNHLNLQQTNDKNYFQTQHTKAELSNNNKLLLHYGSMQTITRVNKKDNEFEGKEMNTKISIIPRRASEEEFKKYNINWFSQNEKCSKLEKEGAVYQKSMKISTGSKEDYKVSIGSKDSNSSNNSKNEYDREPSKFATNLKETTSTTSADTMSVAKKQLPAFLKCKSKTLLNKKIFTHRFGRENFKIYKKLGEGKFGKVFLVKEIESGFVCAMKVVEKKKIIEDGLLEQFVRELKIQFFLNHPNIIEVYGFFQDSVNFYTLMELGCDGQLYNLICEKKKLTEEGTSFITKNLLQAVDYMHNLNILHRDLKPENIVRIMGNVKICDFGWAANKLTKEELRSTYCGTPLYLSPEILNGQKYDEKVDLWAIGVLAYELLMGESPFEINDHQDLVKIVIEHFIEMTDKVNFPIERKVSKEFIEFVEHILDKDPKKRFSSSNLLSLKFIQKYEALETCEELCS